MLDSFSRSWDLLGESLSLLAHDKRLLLFPVISAIATVLVNLTFLMPLYASGLLPNLALGDRLRHADTATYGLIFLFYYINYFVTIFFNSALVAAAGLSLEGAQVTVNDGLRAAVNRLGRIAYWALVASTVGLLLRAIQRRAGRAVRLASGLFGMSWSLITYFIVPVLVFEDLPVFDSVDRSVVLFRRAWGEEVASGFSFGVIWLVASIPGFLLLWVGLQSHSAIAISIGILYFLLLATVASAAKGIFTTALYRYAAHAEVPNWFTSHLISGAFASPGGGAPIRLASTQTAPPIQASVIDVEMIPSEIRDTYLIRAKAGEITYRASYELGAADPGFRPDAWGPGTPVELHTSGNWLRISGPGCPELWCRFFKDPCPSSGPGK